MTVTCPYCGDFEPKAGQFCQTVSEGDGFAYVCPTCNMTAGEHAYRARILADSDAVYAQEAREFQARRAAERVAS